MINSTLNEETYFSYLFSGLTTLDVDHTLNLGGLETFPTFFPDPDDIDPHFEGCMRNLKLNGKEYPLTVEAGWRGLSIGNTLPRKFLLCPIN